MGGMKVEKVDGIMDGNKAARRENMYGGGMGVPVGKGSGIGVITERRKSPAKPKGKRDSEGRYNFSKGGSAKLVKKAMDVQKPN